jgi:hypothetical protein
MKNWLVLVLVAVSVAACSNPVRDLRSPCVGAEGSPCDRRPVNDWWIT